MIYPVLFLSPTFTHWVVPENIHLYPIDGILSKTVMPLWKF